MNEQIKQRTAQLNNGEVPNGYEKTEIGTFPVGWKTTTLDELLEFKNGVNADKEKYNSGVKMISVMDILTDSPIYYDKIKGQVDIDKKTLGTYSVTYGDILFQRSSETFEDAGKSNVYLDQDRTATYSGFVIRGKKKADYNPYFLNEALRIGQVRNQIIRNAAGSQHINVGQDSLAKIIVPLASDAEQSKIAEILMKWDEAIELEEQSIIILEVRKNSIMKRLLTPQEDWRYVLLGDICQIKTGRLDANAMDEDGIYPFFTCSKDIYRINQYSFDCEALLIAGNGDIGDVKYYNGKFDAYQRTYVMSEFTFNIKYVMQYLRLNFDKDVMKGMQKSSMPYIKLDLLKKAKIYYKVSAIESTVAILSIVDNEIELHQLKLSELKKQRKALQQYLLNGIVRVEV